MFTNAQSDVARFKSFMPIKDKVTADVSIGRVTPLYGQFCVPGDVWRLSNSNFIRSQPMLAPLLTDVNASMRYFFVPLRLCDDNTELIITGSQNGKLSDVALPVFKSMFDEAEDYDVIKYSILDYLMSMPLGNYKKVKNNDCMPAQYWLKAIARIWFDFYRDENLSEYDEFEDFWDTWKTKPGKIKPFYANWKKDYFVGCLPFQQKGIQPSFNISLINSDDGSSVFPLELSGSGITYDGNVRGFQYNQSTKEVSVLGGIDAQSGSKPVNLGVKQITGSVDLTGTGGPINANDIRILMQTQRVFERLARCGSRYNEYLNSTFGTAPADGYLQRAQYLGGYKQVINVSAIEQQGGDGQSPVGTLRGKGTLLSGGSLDVFNCKEFGVIIGFLEIMPKAVYTQGIPRIYTYKDRFDFFNPSFQFLSEQEVKNGEVFVELNPPDDNLNINDDTFGFEEMYSELKIGRDRLSGDMRDTQDYWTMARYFGDTPVLSEEFIQARDTIAFGRPFAVTDAPQFIVESATNGNVWRCMARYGTPGFNDHF